MKTCNTAYDALVAEIVRHEVASDVTLVPVPTSPDSIVYEAISRERSVIFKATARRAFLTTRRAPEDSASASRRPATKLRYIRATTCRRTMSCRHKSERIQRGPVWEGADETPTRDRVEAWGGLVLPGPASGGGTCCCRKSDKRREPERPIPQEPARPSTRAGLAIDRRVSLATKAHVRSVATAGALARTVVRIARLSFAGPMPATRAFYRTGIGGILIGSHSAVGMHNGPSGGGVGGQHRGGGGGGCPGLPGMQ